MSNTPRRATSGPRPPLTTVETLCGTPHAALRSSAAQLTFLVVLCVALSVPYLEGPALWRSQEARVAWIVRTMLRTGDLITPRGPAAHLWDDKPPLFHWLACLVSARAGMTEFTLRLPTVVAAIALVLLVYGWSASLWGREAGLAAGVVLATSAKFVGAARAARVDVLLALFTTAMLMAFWSAYTTRGRRRGYALVAFYAAAAGATLSKGPVLAALPVVAIVIFLALRRDLRFVGSLRPVLGVGVVVALCGWWFVAVHVKTDGAFTYGFFVNHHWKRFAGGENVGHFLNPGPVYSYVPMLFAGLMPWPIMAAFGAVAALTDRRRRRVMADDPAMLLILWAALVVVFFSAARIKRADYVLPVYPALAVLVGRVVFGPTAAAHRRWLTRVFLIHVIGAAVIYLILFLTSFEAIGSLVLGWMEARGSATDRETVARYLEFFNRNRWVPWTAGVVLMASAFVAWASCRRGRPDRAFLSAAGGVAVTALIYHAMVLPLAEPIRQQRDLAHTVRQTAGREARIVYLNDSFLQLSYYVNRPAEWIERERVTRDDVAEWTDGGRRPCLIVMRREDYHRLVAPSRRALGLTVAVEDEPTHIRPCVVLTARVRRDRAP